MVKSYGTKRIKRPNRKPSCNPYRGDNKCWTIRFIYRGEKFSQSFGKCQQGRINADYISRSILLDIKNDRFIGSIEDYLNLIPPELITWRRHPLLCRPFQTGIHNHWAIRFIYQGIRYTHGFGRGNQAGVNANIVSKEIVADIKNDRFLGNIEPYLRLIPEDLITWRKPPKKIRISDGKEY